MAASSCGSRLAWPTTVTPAVSNPWSRRSSSRMHVTGSRDPATVTPNQSMMHCRATSMTSAGRASKVVAATRSATSAVKPLLSIAAPFTVHRLPLTGGPAHRFSEHELSAVDVDHLTGHELPAVGSQVHARLGDV